MIRRREILGVAAVSAFLGAVLALFLFGSLGGEVTPGQPAAAAATPSTAAVGGTDPGVPLTTTTFSNVASKVMSAVVIITSEKTEKGPAVNMPFGNDPFMRRFFQNPFGEQPQERRERGLGSGVIVSRDGYILTNNHVVSGADKVQVRMDRHRTLSATLVGADPRSDLAVLKVDEQDLPVVRFGDSDELKIGEWVMAVGAPFGLERSVTVGIVSAKGRSNVGVTGAGGYEDFIQTDAAINHGNSGGALVNLDGELVGINTAIASSTGGSNGVGFAIPINMAQQIMKSLISEGKVTRGYLGIIIQNVDEKLARAMDLAQDTGVLVSEVKPGPAEKAGVKVGDVIVKLEGQPVDDTADLRNRVAALAPGTDVQLDILRGREQRTLTARLTEVPRDEAAGGGTEGGEDQPGDPDPAAGREGRLGLEIRTLTPELAGQLRIDETRGVLVTAVQPGSRAEDAGVAPNDVVIEVNKEAVASVDQFRRALGRPAAGDAVLMRVLRGDSYLFLVIEM